MAIPNSLLTIDQYISHTLQHISSPRRGVKLRKTQLTLAPTLLRTLRETRLGRQLRKQQLQTQLATSQVPRGSGLNPAKPEAPLACLLEPSEGSGRELLIDAPSSM